jgi:hypothetical protein
MVTADGRWWFTLQSMCSGPVSVAVHPTLHGMEIVLAALMKAIGSPQCSGVVTTQCFISNQLHAAAMKPARTFEASSVYLFGISFVCGSDRTAVKA